MDKYDPQRAPDPKSWLDLDEDERLLLVLASIRKGERLPTPKLHAAIHLIVENQIAMGDETPAAAVLERLLDEGLGRHDAVHAIGSVLSRHAYHAVTRDEASTHAGGDPNEPYWRDLDELTADSWRRSR